MALHLKKLESPLRRDTFCQVWLKLTPLHFTLDNGIALHLNKLESHLQEYALYKVWLNSAQSFLRRLLYFVIFFCYFIIIFPRLKWASGYGDKILKNFVDVFSSFRYKPLGTFELN